MALLFSHAQASPQGGDTCLKVCWPEKHECAGGMFPKNVGTEEKPCWTCCQ
ncbi:hypothetical protein AJ79_04774 [Helicocarpus griseus UAMH5409]|uniref:Uncharacterized protein n=1 Tax=Helicocarpus griseus UAMH5409 TaxID=1447875 RepID=A0A2B7XIS8_9EURO|nr:hypothetical protein AJ79_04774 [Helicocarpus griseus UAMH5409]